jgi:sugar phosphate isomerase/epimerase
MIRRKFIKGFGATVLSAPLVNSTFEKLLFSQLDDPLEIHLFSKHLQFLDIKSAAEIAAQLGFKGLDLTVRPKGHVLPENVETDLPIAKQQIEDSGVACDMITTTVADVSNPIDLKVVKTAAEQGVKYYRSDWFEYKRDKSLEASLEYYKEKIQQLSEFNKEHEIIGCYQNHSGTKIGASVWEVKKIIESANPEFFGVQYDIRHAVAEGGRSWPNGVQLLKDHIKTIVLKDFKWGKMDGKWQIINVPIGEGMVDFLSYFKLLKNFGFRPPVSLHLEYPLGGAEKGLNEITVDQNVIYDAMRNDLKTIQQLWKNAK